MTTGTDAELREARRARVFDAMDAGAVDALVLGRRDSVAYATGARSLWTAGTRPFGAACVLVAGRRSVHLLSSWDEGVPPEVPFEQLYGVTWNPAVMAGSLGSIPGFGDAHRIGVDGLSLGFERAARRLAPDVELVSADDLVLPVRAVKLPAEVERIGVAVGVAEAGVDAAAAALAVGATPVEALATALSTVAADGVTIPSSAPVVEPVQSAQPAGSLVRIDLGLLVDGYEGGRGRTVVAAGQTADASLDATETVQRHLLDACHASATAHDLRAAAGGATCWTVRGSGMGFEHPVVTDALGADVVLDEGMVLSVEVDVDGVHRRDLALVGADAAEAL